MHRTAILAFTACILSADFCRMASADEAPAPLHRSMPKVTFSNREDFYPAPAKRSGLEGVVSVALSIDGKGSVVNPSIVYSDAEVFSQGVLRLLSTAHYAVPADWEASGQNDNRYVLSIRFELAPCGHLPHFDLRDTTVDVCGTRLPGSTPHRATEGVSAAH